MVFLWFSYGFPIKTSISSLPSINEFWRFGAPKWLHPVNLLYTSVSIGVWFSLERGSRKIQCCSLTPQVWCIPWVVPTNQRITYLVTTSIVYVPLHARYDWFYAPTSLLVLFWTGFVLQFRTYDTLHRWWNLPRKSAPPKVSYSPTSFIIIRETADFHASKAFNYFNMTLLVGGLEHLDNIFPSFLWVVILPIFPNSIIFQRG